MAAEKRKLLRCYHCGNVTLHDLIFEHDSEQLYDEFEAEEKDQPNKIYETFKHIAYECSTCKGLNMIGGFLFEDGFERLYPIGPNIQPPIHHWAGSQPVPLKLIKIYEEIWHLKHQAPNAFGNQIRRCLEYICIDKGADGKNLFEKLSDLSTKGYLPGSYQDLSNVIRKVGNIGSHFEGKELDYWDVELLDEFFRILVSYIYIVPAKLKRMEQRLNTKTQD